MSSRAMVSRRFAVVALEVRRTGDGYCMNEFFHGGKRWVRGERVPIEEIDNATLLDLIETKKIYAGSPPAKYEGVPERMHAYHRRLEADQVKRQRKLDATWQVASPKERRRAWESLTVAADDQERASMKTFLDALLETEQNPEPHTPKET